MAKTADAKTVDAAKGQAATTDAPPKSRKVAWIAGLVIACASGATLAVAAMPKKAAPTPTLDGPFVAALAKASVQVNLAGENGKRYLVLGLNAEYFAYDESYTTARLGGDDGHGGVAAPDPLYTAMLTDSLLRIAGGKTREQVEDPVQMEAFLMEIRAAVEPLLFPLCVGDSHALQMPDSHSGLRVGESVMDSTLRGLLHEHFLQLDVAKKTVRLDDGPETTFLGDERDLRITGTNGEVVYLNVSALEPEFAGKVPIGVAGRVRRIYREQVLVQ